MKCQPLLFSIDFSGVWHYLRKMDALAHNILLRKRAAQVAAAFLQTEIEVGHTFCQLAKCSQDDDLATKHLRQAKDALESVSKYM
jgi:hypothetical protein